MKPITYTAPFKPSGKEYTKLCMWNRFIHNKLRLVVMILPVILGIYFLATTKVIYFMPVYLVLALYPFITVIAFYFKIKKHLKFRSKADEATAQFTIMDNGILTERAEVDINKLYHWDEFDKIIDIRDFLLLYKSNRLVLVLQKEYMPEGEASNIRDIIAEHIYKNKSK